VNAFYYQMEKYLRGYSAQIEPIAATIIRQCEETRQMQEIARKTLVEQHDKFSGILSHLTEQSKTTLAAIESSRRDHERAAAMVQDFLRNS
jgi:hypothetical protein